VLSRGAIVMQGLKQIEVQNKSVTEGEVSFKLKVSAEIAPDVQIVAYAVLPSETVIAHSADFSTEKCFSNKVSVEFSPSSAVPREGTNLQVTAQPDSLCGVSAVDQSILIKVPGKTLEAEQIFGLLPVRKVSHTPYDVQDPVDRLHVRPRRYILPYPPDRDDRSDAHTVFQNVGLKMATNLLIQVPSCLRYRGREYHQGYGISMRYDNVPGVSRVVMGQAVPAGGFGGSYPEDISPIETVRTFFPETWIWDLVEVGESGTKDVPFTVPDTITTWETEAFCLSPQGFGLAPHKEIKVFQPFFLELNLPYSIIQGEHFELKATTFNYLSSCIMVTVIPAPSLDYTLTPLSGNQYTSRLCGSERKTLSWTMAPSVLGAVNVSVTAKAVASHALCGNEIVSMPERGRIDVVTRCLIVKAEGTEMTKNYNWLLCPKDEALTEEVDIELPENVIDGSARATLSVLGDILGRALKNLDGLLRMPYGCGEQNMALLAPNIYILQYLRNTQQLTPAITEKSTNYLTSGYQRQLNYKHSDGAYSTFGAGAGNTWLTAFVLRSFAKAQSFIFIDPTKIEESKTWLERKQRENGCFEQSGKLFNNRMKGGVSDEVTLSAYITAAFLEMNMSVNDAVVKQSLSCLRESMSDLSNTYTTALLAYVFTLAGDMEACAHLLKHLDAVALRQGGFLHWSQTATETSASLSVEISSYVLLAKLSASPIAEDLGYATPIVRWLTGQQNYYGGFSSTQFLSNESEDDQGLQTMKATLLDTVHRRFRHVESEPLYTVATLLDPQYKDRYLTNAENLGYAKAALKAAVKVEEELKTTPPSDETVSEPVNKTPRMEGASSSLGSIFDEILEESSTAAGPSEQITPGAISERDSYLCEAPIERSPIYLNPLGSGISLHYNIPTPTDVDTLSVEVTPEADCTRKRPKLTLKLKSLYSGKESTTNMVILDIKMLSGFVPDPKSLKRLKGAQLVDRVEQKEDHILVYLQRLSKDIHINNILEIVQEHPVQNLKPAVVKIYDYYQTSDQAETEYTYPCVAA
ncbi:pregnancy zone protein-like, partial [Sparus aurata]|uniref:pregnancy zone protein-like n=1 Tax=Sparus aurata TaxID=8175 RepID=UPI0011C1421F